VRLDGISKYYHCPACRGKTLIRGSNLDIFNPQPSVFPEEILPRFPPLEEQQGSFDFHCRMCTRPVRLIFGMQERGMGGHWYPFVTEVQELV